MMHWNGIYALNIHHPIATFAHSLRARSRILRGRRERATFLPQVHWSAIFPPRKIRLTETAKRSGNVALGELAIIAQAAARVPEGSNLIEIGTFDGRTTLNLALNAPPSSLIFTLDLPPNQITQFTLANGERQYVEKPAPGARFRQRGCSRIVQLLGDSATFDWSRHYGRAGLVFVDGSHSYEYARCDSATAMKLLTPTGTIIWHDYGVWDGVTRAIDELSHRLDLRHIRGTSLVAYTGRGKSSESTPSKNRN